MAESCRLSPATRDDTLGKTMIEASTADVTESGTVPVTPVEGSWAVMVMGPPTPLPTASPVLLMVATLVVEDVHRTELVMLAVLLSLEVPMAVNCCVGATLMEPAAGRKRNVPAPDCEPPAGIALVTMTIQARLWSIT